MSFIVLYCLCLQLALHNAEANTTEHSDLFHTVNSHTFHNLSPNTAYFMTITAVNKGKSGPTVSVNVTTQRAPGNRVYSHPVANCQVGTCICGFKNSDVFTIKHIYRHIGTLTCYMQWRLVSWCPCWLYIPSLAVSPLAITTGALGAMVVMGMVAVPLLIGCTWSVVLCFSLSNSKHNTTMHQSCML